MLLTNLEAAIICGVISVCLFCIYYLAFQSEYYALTDDGFQCTVVTFLVSIIFALFSIVFVVCWLLYGEDPEMLLKQQIHIEEQVQKEREEERQKPERIQELKDRLDALKIENAKYQEKGE